MRTSEMIQNPERRKRNFSALPISRWVQRLLPPSGPKKNAAIGFWFALISWLLLTIFRIAFLAILIAPTLGQILLLAGLFLLELLVLLTWAGIVWLPRYLDTNFSLSHIRCRRQGAAQSTFLVLFGTVIALVTYQALAPASERSHRPLAITRLVLSDQMEETFFPNRMSVLVSSNVSERDGAILEAVIMGQLVTGLVLLLFVWVRFAWKAAFCDDYALLPAPMDMDFREFFEKEERQDFSGRKADPYD